MRWKIILIFAASILQIARAGQTVAMSQTPPAEITLNGLMTIFDEKRALFKICEQNSNAEKDLTLSEGETASGIELISVDLTNAQIKVNNRGTLQVISISKAQWALFEPDVVPDAWDAYTGGASNYAEIVRWQNRMLAAEAQNKNENSPAYSTASGVSGSEGNSSGNSDSSSSQNQIAGSADNSTPTQDPWWVRGSKLVEQARIQSAQDVLNGTADPQPLTPLTPRSTPAALIGPDRLFFDHM